MSMTMTDNAKAADARIYVACLAAYNGGRLHGAWISAEQDADAIQADVDAMLKASPEPDAEEWAIHDYEGFHGMRIEESDSFETVAELAEVLAEHGAAYAAYADNIGRDYATPGGFEESYWGEHESEREFGWHFVNEMGLLDAPKPEPYGHATLIAHFDIDSYTRDLFMDGFSSHENPEGGIFVFADY